MTDDEVLDRVTEAGGTLQIPRGGRWSSRARNEEGWSEHQLKRLVREGRLTGGTVTIAPWLGPPAEYETQGIYVSIYKNSETGDEVTKWEDIPKNEDGTRDRRFRYDGRRQVGEKQVGTGASSSMEGGVWLQVSLP